MTFRLFLYNLLFGTKAVFRTVPAERQVQSDNTPSLSSVRHTKQFTQLRFNKELNTTMPTEQLAQNFPQQGENIAINWLKIEASKVSDQMMNRAVAKNVWSALVSQEAFENGNGFRQRVHTWERSAMTTQPELLELNQYTATHMPEGDVVGQGFTERSFSLGFLTLRSHNINIINVHTVKNYNEQLAHYMQVLTDHAIQINSDINEQGFAEQCDFKIVLRSEDGEIMDGLYPDYSAADGMTRWKNLPATACPTNECLEKLKARLDQENASSSTVLYSGGSGTGTYQLVLSAELSRFLRRGGPSKLADGTDNPDYTDIRYMDDALAKRCAGFGEKYAYNGFQHVINTYTPRFRYDFQTAKYVRVMPFKKVTRHNVGDAKQSVQFDEYNKEYEEAPFEMFHIYTPNVVKSVVMNLNNSVGGAKFDASSTMGVWEFFCPKDISNRWGDNGFFQWRMVKGMKPYNTRHGMSVICLRPKFAKLYSTATGTVIPLGGVNSEDKFFDGADVDKTLAQLGEHIATLPNYNSMTNLHISLPDIALDSEDFYTGIGDAVPVDREWVYPFGKKPRAGQSAKFPEGSDTLVVPCIRSAVGTDGKPVKVTAEIVSDTNYAATVGDITVETVDSPSPNQVYVILKRANGTTKVAGTLKLKANGAENDGNKIAIYGDGE